MASSHSRNASTADRRSINAAGLSSRGAPVRAREHEKPYVRDDGSPILSENSADPADVERAFNKQKRQTNDLERRTERTFTTTKEKAIRTRSPVKESASIGNRKEPSRVRRSIQSPVEKKKGKEVEQGMARVLSFRNRAYSPPVGPWTPSATLIAHSSAPLATRVSAPPLSSTAPLSL